MKNFKLVLALSALMLSVTNLAQADNTNKLNHQFMSKRAYHAPVGNSETLQPDTQWEGATYRPTESNIQDIQGANNLKQLKINSLAKRSFM